MHNVPIVKRRYVALVSTAAAAAALKELVEAHQNLLEARLVERANWFAQITIHIRIVEIKRRGRVIGQNPRKHGILIQIVVGAAGNRIEMHQIIKVAYLAALPSRRDARATQKFKRGLGAQRDERGWAHLSMHGK